MKLLNGQQGAKGATLSKPNATAVDGSGGLDTAAVGVLNMR